MRVTRFVGRFLVNAPIRVSHSSRRSGRVQRAWRRTSFSTIRLGLAAVSDRVLDFVTLGWDLPGWPGDFYPSDLPAQWRLTYFSNAFGAVLVPAELWSGADAAQLGVWVDDVNPGFRFYLEFPPNPPGSSELAVAVAAFGDKLAGLAGSFEAPSGMPAPFFRSRYAPCEAGIWASPVACRVPRYDMDLPAARHWLESVARCLKGGSGLVIVDGPGVRADDLRRWLDLAWMLGVA